MVLNMSGKSNSDDWARALQAANQMLAAREVELASARAALIASADAAAQVDAMHQAQADMERRIADALQRERTLSEELSTARASLESQRESLEHMNALRQALADIENRLSDTRQHEQVLISELAAAQSRRQAVDVVLAEHQAELASVRARLEATLADLAASENAHDMLERSSTQEIESLRASWQAAQSRIHAAQAQVKNLQDDSLRNKAEIAQLNQRLNDVEESRQALHRTLDEVRAAGAQDRMLSQIELAEVRTRAHRLLMEVRALRRAGHTQAAAAATREAAAQRLHMDQLDQAHHHADELRKTLADRETTLRDLQRLASENSAAHAESARQLSEQLLRAQQEAMAKAAADQASLAKLQADLICERDQARHHSATHADRARQLSEQLLRTQQQAIAQTAADQASLAELQADLMRERDQARDQLNDLRSTINTMASHWTWRWTGWLRPIDDTSRWSDCSSAAQRSPSCNTNPASPLLTTSLNVNTFTVTNESPMNATLSDDVQRSATSMHDSNAFSSRLAGPAAHVDDLLLHHDLSFIEATYFSLLGRAPDATGRSIYLSQLRGGRSRESIIAAIARSQECRSKGPTLGGLAALMRSERRGALWLWQRVVSRWIHAPGTHGDDLVRRTANDVMRSLNQLSDQVDNLERRMDGMESRLASVVATSIRSTTMMEPPSMPSAAGLMPARTPESTANLSAEQEKVFDKVRQMLSNGHGKEST